MADEIYVIGRGEEKPEHGDLSEEERKEIGRKLGEAHEELGGEAVLRLVSRTGKGLYFVDKYPNLEAWDKAFDAIFSRNGLWIGRYWDFEIDLCREQ